MFGGCFNPLPKREAAEFDPFREKRAGWLDAPAPDRAPHDPAPDPDEELERAVRALLEDRAP